MQLTTAATQLTIALLLGGCQGLGISASDSGPYFNNIPTGSTLTLQYPLVIRAEQVRVSVPRTGGAGGYTTSCSLELWTRNEQQVVVEPDTFVITRIRGGLTPILVSNPKPIMVASRGHLPRLAYGADGSSFLRSYAEFFLESERQPDVYRLTCGYMDDPWEVEPLTIAEIREALDDFFVLELAITASDH